MSGPGSAIVIGYGPGVGAATAQAFATAGYEVVVVSRRGTASSHASSTRGTGPLPRHFAADAGDESSLVAALDAARHMTGDPAVVVYNAARWRAGPLLALTSSDLVDDYRTCVVGAFVAARWAAPAMKASGVGTILFTGGGLSMNPSSDAPTLSIGKGAVRALALMLADELAPFGVRAGTVTIAAAVGSDGLSASTVADAFMRLHRSAPDRATAEIVLRSHGPG